MPEVDSAKLEKVFSDLAFVTLRDKAASLVPYLLGFQSLLEEDDGRRAVGIFGFEIDGAVFYVPVFFINGEIRGMDSIYSLESDLFLPLSENWIDYIINKKSIKVGDKADKESVRQLVRRPSSIGWQSSSIARNIPTKIAAAMSTFRKDSDLPQLPQLLKEAGVASVFRRALMKNAALRRCFTEFYDILDLADDVQTASIKTAAEKKVVIVDSVTDPDVDLLTDEQRRDVLAGEVAVIDRRDNDQISKVYLYETELTLENPDSPGLYDIVYADGTLLKACLFDDYSHLSTMSVYIGPSKPFGKGVPVQSIYVTKKYASKEFGEYVAKYAVDVTQLSPNQTFMLVSLDGVSCGVYTIENRSVSPRGDISYSVLSYSDAAIYDAEATAYIGGALMSQDTLHAARASHFRRHPPSIKEIIVRQTNFTRPNIFENIAAISATGFFALPVKLYDKNNRLNTLSYSKLRPQIAIRDMLERHTVPIEVWKDGREYVIRDQWRTVVLKKAEAMRHLLLQYNIGEADARAMLKQATADPTTWHVKLAATSGAAFSELDSYSAGNELNPNIPAESPVAVISSSDSPDNRAVYEYFSGEHSIGRASPLAEMQAAIQAGQKEVFDAAVLHTLLKAKFPSEIVERFLPVLLAGVDRLGRILFIIYWNYKEFAKKYGEQEFQQLLDDIRSTFLSLGESVFTLQQNRISSDSDLFSVLSVEDDVELNDAAI